MRATLSWDGNRALKADAAPHGVGIEISLVRVLGRSGEVLAATLLAHLSAFHRGEAPVVSHGYVGFCDRG